MSYTHGKEYFRVTGQDFAGAGIKGTFSPGVHPFILRKVSVVVSVTPGATPPVLTIRHRPTAGSATAQATVDTITVPANTAAGKVVYVEDLDQKVVPGQHIVFDVTTAGGAGAIADIVAELDPVWDHLGNNSNAILSA